MSSSRPASGDLLVLPPAPAVTSRHDGPCFAPHCSGCKHALSADATASFSADLHNLPAAGDSRPDGRVWECVRGPFAALNVAVLSLRNAKAPLGLCPPGHLASGHGDIIALRRCSRWGLVRFLLGVTAGSHLTLGSVVHRPCTEVIFVPQPDDQRPSSWNVDGEFLANQPVHFKIVPQALMIMAQGIYAKEPS